MAASDNSRRRIAVVEDDPAVLHSLEFALEAEGYQVSAFDTAGAALASPEAVKADCLVIDYRLPDGDGIAMLQALRARGQASPAIVIASSPSTRCRCDAAAEGVPLLEKPLIGRDLAKLIRALLAEAPKPT